MKSRNTLLINLGIVKLCSKCSFKTESRKEIREHGLRVHRDKHCQYNDTKYQLERLK